MITLTSSAFDAVAPRPKTTRPAAIWDGYVGALSSPEGTEILRAHKLYDNDYRLLTLLANMIQESMFLTALREDLRYGVKALLGAGLSPDEAEAIALNDKAVGERLYGLGNPSKARELGNTQPGDGWRYRGGGLLQITGRDNYTRLGSAIGVDLANQPELVENPLVSLKVGCQYWTNYRLNDYADRSDFKGCCNGVNFGAPNRKGKPKGYPDRLRAFRQLNRHFGIDLDRGLERPFGYTDAPEGQWQIGERNDDIRDMQQTLQDLGYQGFNVDGVFDHRTFDALRAFQRDHQLLDTGWLDDPTWVELNRSAPPSPDPADFAYGEASAFSDLTPQDIDDLLADRERELNEFALRNSGDGELEAATRVLTPQEARAMISDKGYDMMIRYETGGRAYYENVIKSRPVVPGFASGVTIGFGYDLGYCTPREFQAAWGQLLPPADFERLAAAVGLTKGPAQDLLRSLGDIRVSWELGEAVFRSDTLPRYVGQTIGVLQHTDELNPNSLAALVSLVFNRGAAFSNPGDKCREMRAIRDDMASRTFADIPGQFRSMERLWNSRGLKARREEEAALFELGLAARPVAPPVVAAAGGAAAAAQSEAVAEAPSLEQDSYDFDQRSIDVIEGAAQEEVGGAEFRVADVSWPKEDADAPDYRHIVGIAGATAQHPNEFTFTARHLTALIELNRFKPQPVGGKILFGLRGAELSGGPAQSFRDGLVLKLARPDHRSFRCVIGVCDLTAMTIAGYIGSTVPNPAAVWTNWHLAKIHGKPDGNMLPTGCYTHQVGTHHGSMVIQGALLLLTSVAVLRSVDDVTYTIHDIFDVCTPYDDIHPSFRAASAPFSSFGCQTVRGTYENGAHLGEWGLFHQAAGLADGGTGDDGKQFAYVLLTGLEASFIAGKGTLSEQDRQQLARIRQGSQGDEVKALQTALRRTPTGKFGAEDVAALARLQQDKLGYNDAIYTPELDSALGFSVFTPPSAAVARATVGNGAQPPVAVAAVASTTQLESVPPSNASASRHAEALLAEDPEMLYRRLGYFSERMRATPKTAGDLELVQESIPELESVSDVTDALGKRIYLRLEDELFQVVCGSDEADQRDRTSISRALSESITGSKSNVVLTAAGILMTTGAAWYAPALVVGAIFAQRIAKGTIAATCEVWREDRQKRLTAPPQGAPQQA